ncbi:MAG: hypothetical protein P8J68_03670 [Arenicellaceae bacterium]|nr:hypothetical protein [Arenicellaceae bacterium]
MQPYKLIVVEHHDTRVLLGEHSFTNKAKVVNTSQLLVFAIYQNLDMAYTEAYLALGNMLTTYAVIGVDASPMEGFTNEKYDEY